MYIGTMVERIVSLFKKFNFKLSKLQWAWVALGCFIALLISIGWVVDESVDGAYDQGVFVEVDESKPLGTDGFKEHVERHFPDAQKPKVEEVLPNNIDNLPAWQKYATHVGADLDESYPRIAILINGLGVNEEIANEVIEKVPAGVSLGFLPYVPNLQELINHARKKEHEVLISIPMEPLSYPRNDPGPYALLTKAGDKNEERLNWILNRATGYVGVANFMGSLFTTSPEDMKPVLESLHKRGLLFMDTRESINSVSSDIAFEIGMPVTSSLFLIDESLDKVDIEQRLLSLEKEAKRVGFTVAVLTSSPVAIDLLVAWAETLKAKGIALVPISSVVRNAALKTVQKKENETEESVEEGDQDSEH